MCCNDPCEALELLQSDQKYLKNAQDFVAGEGVLLSAKLSNIPVGDDPKQFVTNYLGAQSNIKLLNSSAQGVGSMSIGNNDAIVRQLPTFESIGDPHIFRSRGHPKQDPGQLLACQLSIAAAREQLRSN